MNIEHQLSHLDALQSACTHCGLCSESCATFQVTHWEHESPRGRIRLARDLMNGKVDPSASVLDTFDHCLGCHACENACPMGVQYSKIRDMVQHLRSILQIKKKPSAKEYRKSILVASRIGSMLWRKYGWKWIRLAREKSTKGSYLKKQKNPMHSTSSLTLIVGCLQDLFDHQMIEEAALLLRKLGYSVYMDPKQPCCGAILSRIIHGGGESVNFPKEREKARRLQLKKATSFLKWHSPMSCALSMGCACFINRLQPNSVETIYTFISEKLKSENYVFSFKDQFIVYYQPYCGQLKKMDQDPILDLLKQVQNLTVRYVGNPYACCGGYAGETHWHPDQAQDLFLYKAEDIPEGSTIIVTSPDCTMQFTAQTSQRFKIVYPFQIFLKAELSFLS